MNNGVLSEAIHPSRGVAQGCCISPLFFVLAIEVLALALRDNPRIEGITLAGYTKKLNLLADDGLLMLKWTQGTMNELVNTLRDFAKVSNLTVNEHKSVIVPLCSAPLSKLDNVDSFKVAHNRECRYLGIDWNLNLSSLYQCRMLSEHNLAASLEAIKNTARQRNQTYHTTIGRILTSKILMVSRFNYIFSAIPSPRTKWLQQVSSYFSSSIRSINFHSSRMTYFSKYNIFVVPIVHTNKFNAFAF